MNSLTKETFWNDLYAAYPDEVQTLYTWLEEYYKRVDWDKLFNPMFHESQITRTSTDGKISTKHSAYKSPKFHDLPIAMQIGIFIQFAGETDSEFAFTVASLKDFEFFPTMISQYFYYENLHNKPKSK